MKRTRGTILVAIVGAVLILPAAAYLLRFDASEPSPAGTPALAGYAMGSNWSVKLRRSDPAAAELRGEIASLLEGLEQQMSHFRPDSELSRFNRHRSGGWFPVSPDLARVVALARQVSQQTHGAFDITVAPLVDLWGFGAGGTPHVPGDDSIRRALEHVGWTCVESRASPPALRKLDPEAAIDLSAIAKGYAVDRVAELLDRRDGGEYLVTLAGELRAKGTWRVGVEAPSATSGRVIHAVDLTDEALSTSGDYRQFFTHNGKRYSHEMDPRVGRPVRHGLASVSVVAQSNAVADALATGLFVLGPEEGMNAARGADVETLFILRKEKDYELRGTRRFERPATMEPAAWRFGEDEGEKRS